MDAQQKGGGYMGAMPGSLTSPTPEAAGKGAEETFLRALKAEGAETFQHELLDRGHFKVDGLVYTYAGKLLPRPVEIQVTLQLDNPGKMDDFLRSVSFVPGAVRLYVEAWSVDVMPTAAQKIAALLRRWTEAPAPERPLFLRVGPEGGWIGDYLNHRLRLLRSRLAYRGSSRRSGTIMSAAAGRFHVRADDGEMYHIPLRLAQASVRNRFREHDNRPLSPQERRIRFFPGIVDKSGIPVFMAAFEDDAMNMDTFAEPALDEKGRHHLREQKEQRAVTERKGVHLPEHMRWVEQRQAAVVWKREQKKVIHKIDVTERKIAKIRAAMSSAKGKNLEDLRERLQQKNQILAAFQERQEALNATRPPEPPL